MVSVIIPCYNSGSYLKEAVDSVKANCGGLDHEILITNDGSDDANTLEVLKEMELNGCVVLHQENKGPAAARNTSVKASKGEYLFFLDSDNLLCKGYIEKGVAILETEQNVGVVYSKPYFFGDSTSRRFEVKDFDLKEILFSNYIDTCSLVRKQAWAEIGGFDEANILIGHEDWEFWINMYQKGWGFNFLQEELYGYRLRDDSLITRINEKERHKKMKAYVFTKHIDLFIETFYFFGSYYFVYQQDQQRPARSFIKFFNTKYLKRRK